ncbi:MAG: tRNA (adenosine(37)-N6)-threonylcarbamoyltransferase complex dimerization subunit type 1 TsaB [Treponema sp.]|nr:tRNA (adenosine(37)-N6)-threonylcarbamoyltransferase complex dimerization subunit type 1 TsaB [Treponema sp.]
MKALAIDSAATKIYIAAKNEDKTVTLTLDIGMKQSQALLPAIDSVLQKVDMQSKELDYTVLCKGPGSFTGLRLGFAAVKAIELAYGIPVYGISTLDTYAHPFEKLPYTLISVMDAKKDHFFACVIENNKKILEDGEYNIDTICNAANGKIFVCGPDAPVFIERAKNLNRELYTIQTQPSTTDSLFVLAERCIEKKEPPLKDFDGPTYLRASEAEEALLKK